MSHLYDLALTVPWCMTDEALEALLSIAAREPLPADEIAQRMHGPKSLALREGTRRDDSRRMQIKNGVALIMIDGPINRYAHMFMDISGGVSTADLAQDFQRAIDDPAVLAVLFVIDSPGGEAIGINELSDVIYAARSLKPVWAYVEGYGASAAYWIASACAKIIIDDSAILGSIGTVMGVPDPAKRMSRTIEFVSSQSPKKRPDPMTQAGRVYLQQHVDDYTEVFIAKVLRNRKLDRDQVLAVEGGLLVGQQAIDAGLADRLGSEEDTIRQLAEFARRDKLPASLPAKAPVRRMMTEGYSMSKDQINKGFWQELFGGLFSAAAASKGAPLEAAIAAQDEPQPLALIEASVDVLRPQLDPTTQARLDALERQLADEQTTRLEATAATFADRAVRDRRVLPAERQKLYSAYLQAAQDDARLPAGRTALIESMVAERLPHTLTEELVETAALAQVLPQAGSTESLSEERRQALLAMTPLGQAALRGRRAT